MPKQTRVNRFSTNCSTSSPYPRCSNDSKHVEFDHELGSPEDIKHWEEARCPFCLDHPHNAVLLRCSSSENGCLPYVCNTSVRHSNCLYQFRKLPASSPSAMILQGGRISISQQLIRAQESEVLPPCPLCRREIHGWTVVQAARRFMNSKSRNCSCETCDFVGNFAELRMHARSEHPFAWPSEPDPERQQNWAQMEQQRNLADLNSISFDHSQNNMADQEGLEELRIDGMEEEVLPAMNEEEEQGGGQIILAHLDSAYVHRSYSVVSSAPLNVFTIALNTVYSERISWLRGRAAVRRPPGTTTGQTPPDGNVPNNNISH